MTDTKSISYVTSALLQMMRMQGELNTTAAGIGWTSGFTDAGRKIRWRLAATMEMAELIDSFSWKHWKDINGKDDIDNARVEIVDIIHFAFSHHLSLVEVHSECGLTEDMVLKFISTPLIDNDIINKQLEKSRTIEKEDLIDELYQFIQFINNHEVSSDELIVGAFGIAGLLGMTFDDVFSLYIGKNVLNQLRQNFGYSDGEYMKIWDGKEDNVVMTLISKDLRESNNFSAESLYSELEKHYRVVKFRK